MPQISISRYNNNSESYRQVAAEYYDARRHPTCANFRSASLLTLTNYSNLAIDGAVICEVGAGKSLYTECVPDWRRRGQTLILNDSVSEMLLYSQSALEEGAEAIVADAETLALPQKADFILCSLGDPYNKPSFWKNCTKILKRGGFLLFTTPSFEWASLFRPPDKVSQTQAEFRLCDGRVVVMPSHIVPVATQINLVTNTGLSVQEFGSVRLNELPDVNISSKLSFGSTLAVVDWFLVKNNLGANLS
ncbi:methyltransferase domain-containing protein [Mesorhizobium sp. BR-1-1-10]|uniref:methyltransferase domain-containing protein n=1 Tax=Mesorhizobium sp. BR-1-1-10 TaxID=2876660 RepID=UPI00398D2870